MWLLLWYRHQGPTWLVFIAVHGGWLGLTIYGANWPTWVVISVGAVVLCAQGSLQHEAIHGHLLSSRCWNDRLVSLPLNLYLPYALYRETHLLHHQSRDLTDPLSDPESYYVSEADWTHMSRFRQALLWCNQTLLGRVLIGPWLVWYATARLAWTALNQVEPQLWSPWGRHFLSVLLVIIWLLLWDFSPLAYFLLVVWPGTSLSMLRSFHEHRPAASLAGASVAVEASWPWRWLFLNNNYHVLHHRDPQLPWFLLHQRYWQERENLLVSNQGYWYCGYLSWVTGFALWPRDRPWRETGMIDATMPPTRGFN